MNKVDVVERSRLRGDIPPFRPGDRVRVHVKVVEGTRERIQVFEGDVIGRRGGGLRETFTVRKVSFGVGVERTFPVHAPVVAKVEIVRHGRARRAKLYYLRALSGRQAKINERRTRIQEWSPDTGEVATDEEPAAVENEPVGVDAEEQAAQAGTEAPAAADAADAAAETPDTGETAEAPAGAGA